MSARHELVLLCVLTAVAAAVRMVVLDAPLYMDEAYSGLAARSILETGFSFFPSGLYYDRDVLYHYALAGALGLGEGSATAGRLLSLLVGLALIPAVWTLVRRLGGSARWALLAAALVAVDPFTASMTPRMRMYPFLQLAGVLLLLAFVEDFLGPDAHRRRFKVRTALAAGFAIASHQLAIFFAPALVLLALARVRGGVRILPAKFPERRIPWLGIATLAVGAAAPLALAWGISRAAEQAPQWKGTITWGGSQHTAEVYEAEAESSYAELLSAKWETAAPHRPAAVARGLVWLAAMGGATALVLRAGGRGAVAGFPGALALYAWLPLILLVLYPRHELPTRWLVHLSPLFLALLAGGIAQWARDRGALSSPRALLWAIGAALLAGWAAAAAQDFEGPLWGTRYVALATLAAWGAAGAFAAWHRGQSTASRFALGAAMAGVVAIGTLMSLGLWWAPGGQWAERMLALRAKIAPDDALVVIGDDVPTVAWAVPAVTGVVPTWRLEYARGDGAHPAYEIASGARVMTSVDALEELARSYRRVWFLASPAPPASAGADRAHYDAVQAPIVEWIAAHASLVEDNARGPAIWCLDRTHAAAW